MSDPAPVSFNERRKFKRKRYLYFDLDNLSKRAKIVLSVVSIAILAFGVYGVIISLHKKTDKKPEQLAIVKGDTVTITQSQFAQRELNYAHSKLESKMYADANTGYFTSASDSYQLKNLNAAKSVLLECIDKVPDQYVTWDVYYLLSTINKDQKNTSDEKKYLKTAQQKGDTKGADINQGQKAAIAQRLKDLGT